MASLMILAWGASVFAAEGPIDSTISYQGRLTDGGDPAEGEHDMRFSLYDAVSGGNQEGPTLVFDGDQPNPDPVDVMGGLFQVGLTFGNGVFLGDALWLEIEVRSHENGQYVTLEPRQPLTAVPYALYALDGPGGEGGYWSARGSHIFNTNSGNVGIGTTTPTDRLHVRGTQPTLRLDDNVDSGSFTEIKDAGTVQLRINKTNISGQVLLDINPKVTDGTSDVQVRFFRETDTTGPKMVQFLRGNFSTQTSARIAVDGGDSFFQAHGGNLGIGTTAPAARLHVAGVAGEDGIMFPDGTLQTTAAGSGGGLWSANANDIFYNNGNVGIGTATPQTMLDIFGEDAVLRVESIRNDFGPKLVFRNRTTGRGVYQGTIQFQDANITLAEVGYRRPRFGDPVLSLITRGGGISILDGGQVGIGISDPEYKLSVNGRIRLRQGESSSAGIWFYQETPAADRAFVGMRGDDQVGFYSREGASWGLVMDTTSGDVGIGDITPNAKLAVLKTDNGSRFALTAINTGTDGGGGYFAVANSSNNKTALFCANVGAGLAFATLGDAVINGDATINGTATVDVLEIVGADLAEKFPVSDKPQPGTVVEIDPDRTGTLRIARGGAYNTRVAGVVSGANDLSVGAILGNLPGQEDAPPIALSGRVWVQCDASTGAIEPGDLLTTSDTPGHAMKATDRARAYGATIGKAMSSLTDGRGLVLVLVSLQ